MWLLVQFGIVIWLFLFLMEKLFFLVRFSIYEAFKKYIIYLLLFDVKKIKMARKPGKNKKQKEHPVWYTEEGKRWKGNIREGLWEGKTETG